MADEDALFENLSDDEIEALLLSDVLEERVPVTHCSTEGLLDVRQMTADASWNLLRFEKWHIQRLASALMLPTVLYTAKGTVHERDEALAVTLRRLAYPNRLYELEPFLGRHSSTLSLVTNQVVGHINREFGHLLEDLTCHDWINLEQFAEAVHMKGAPLKNCWGFIDGTARQICRPTEDQKRYFSGHKRFHCIKYQAVMCPNGIIVRLDGTYEGNRHDAGILRDSGLYLDLEAFMNGRSYVLYGNPAYPLRPLLQKPFSSSSITTEQMQFNKAMSSVRQCVEWGFGMVVAKFAFLDSHKNQTLLRQHLPAMYKAAVILTNFHTCLYASQTSDYFNMSPPLLETYLRQA